MEFCRKKKTLSNKDFEKNHDRHWIRAAFDPKSKLIIHFFIGQIILEDWKCFIHKLKGSFRSKTSLTSDELLHYEMALVNQFSHLETYPKRRKQGRPKNPRLVIDPELLYVIFHKTKDNGKVIKVDRMVVFDSAKCICLAITVSKVSIRINNSFIERTNLALSNYSIKLTRKTLCFAKIKQLLNAQTSIVLTYYNFFRPHRGLTMLSSVGKRIKRIPAKAANIIDRIWPMDEMLACPRFQQ